MEPNFKNRVGWKRIYPDLPGMGKTLGHEGITNSDKMLDVVCEFIDAVISNEPFVVGGYSYGAYLARGVLQRKSHQVDGLLLVCPDIIANSSERMKPPQEVLVKDPELISKLNPQEKEMFETFGAVQSQRIWDRTQAEVIVGVELADEPYVSHLFAEGFGFSFDVDASTGQFQKPTLIMAGRQDWVVGYRDAWDLIEQYPRATYAVLDKGGHNLPIEQEALFNSLVREWLDRVEES
jgi:pimeloyl-ACP methyl ester carboxylesterase